MHARERPLLVTRFALTWRGCSRRCRPEIGYELICASRVRRRGWISGPAGDESTDRFHAIAANQGCIRQLESAERFTCGRAEPALSTSIGSQPGSRYVLCHDSERRRHHDNTRLLELRALVLISGPAGRRTGSEWVRRGRQPLCRRRVPHRHEQARREPRRVRTCGRCGSGCPRWCRGRQAAQSGPAPPGQQGSRSRVR